jgi:hypothetical protein
MLALKLFLLRDYMSAFLAVIGSSGFCLWSELRTSMGKFQGSFDVSDSENLNVVLSPQW